MGVNTILTHSGRGDQSVEVRSVNPVVMRASDKKLLITYPFGHLIAA